MPGGGVEFGHAEDRAIDPQIVEIPIAADEAGDDQGNDDVSDMTRLASLDRGIEEEHRQAGGDRQEEGFGQEPEAQCHAQQHRLAAPRRLQQPHDEMPGDSGEEQRQGVIAETRHLRKELGKQDRPGRDGEEHGGGGAPLPKAALGRHAADDKTREGHGPGGQAQEQEIIRPAPILGEPIERRQQQVIEGRLLARLPIGMARRPIDPRHGLAEIATGPGEIAPEGRARGFVRRRQLEGPRAGVILHIAAEPGFGGRRQARLIGDLLDVGPVGVLVIALERREEGDMGDAQQGDGQQEESRGAPQARAALHGGESRHPQGV